MHTAQCTHASVPLHRPAAQDRLPDRGAGSGLVSRAGGGSGSGVISSCAYATARCRSTRRAPTRVGVVVMRGMVTPPPSIPTAPSHACRHRGGQRSAVQRARGQGARPPVCDEALTRVADGRCRVHRRARVRCPLPNAGRRSARRVDGDPRRGAGSQPHAGGHGASRARRRAPRRGWTTREPAR